MPLSKGTLSKETSVSFTVRLPVSLDLAVREMAAAEQRSMAYIVERIVREALAPVKS